jgi:hypothetical protein
VCRARAYRARKRVKRIENPVNQMNILGENTKLSDTEALDYIGECYSSITDFKQTTTSLEIEFLKRAGGGFYNLIKNPSEDTQIAFVRLDAWNIEDIINPSKRVKMEAIKTDGLVLSKIKYPTSLMKLEAFKQNKKSIKYIQSIPKVLEEYIQKNVYRRRID